MNQIVQDGTVIGNVVDKANLSNPVLRTLVKRFDRVVFGFLRQLAPSSIHEVGCGEGRLTRAIAQRHRVPLRATDIGRQLIQSLRQVAGDAITAVERSIYELDAEEDHADVAVCCEVLEHLERPLDALAALRRIDARRYILSVPCEPLWSFLNVARGKYLTDLGNTPGHVQNWSPCRFLHLLAKTGFAAEVVRLQLPWTVVMGRFSR